MREVWFVITPQNPAKQNENLLGNRERQHLVNLAIGDYPKFRVSDIEFNLPKPNYTINTLVYMEEKFPNKNLVCSLVEIIWKLFINGKITNLFWKIINYMFIKDRGNNSRP